MNAAKTITGQDYKHTKKQCEWKHTHNIKTKGQAGNIWVNALMKT